MLSVSIGPLEETIVHCGRSVNMKTEHVEIIAKEFIAEGKSSHKGAFVWTAAEFFKHLQTIQYTSSNELDTNTQRL